MQNKLLYTSVCGILDMTNYLNLFAIMYLMKFFKEKKSCSKKTVKQSISFIS